MAELKLEIVVQKIEDGDVVAIEARDPLTQETIMALREQISDVVKTGSLHRTVWLVVPEKFKVSVLDPAARAKLRQGLDAADAAREPGAVVPPGVVRDLEARGILPKPLTVWDDRTERSRYGRDIERGATG